MRPKRSKHPTLGQYQAYFWSQVDIRGDGECWPWAGRVGGSEAGLTYGRFAFRGRDYGAHVIALMFDGRPVPKGGVGMHSCDFPPCCNPRHLRPATQLENRRDAAAKNRTAKGAANGMNTCPERRPDQHHPHPAQAGERHGMAKLSIEDVLAVRAEYTGARGDLIKLGRQYGVSYVQIRRIVQGKAWATDAAMERT